MNDLISRQAAIDIEHNATVDTNPSHFEAHQKFTQFLDDAEISSFGRWQWSNGFNTALTAVGIDLKKLPSAPPAQQWIPIDKNLPDKRELPDNYVDVLISIEDAVFIAYRLGIHWHISGGGEKFIDFADAWMPMPEPFKEE